MNFESLTQGAVEYLEKSELNYISQEDALHPRIAGMKIYDAPIFGVASADAENFKTLLRAEVVGPETLMPDDILPGANSVISFFIPFSERVRKSNAEERKGASLEWQHGRIEGQMALADFAKHLCEMLKAEGYDAVVPSESGKFQMQTPVRSNWSERHAAWVCGLGTFGLSRGLITEKGMAGRIGSVVTNAVFPETKHDYAGAFDYCIMCGACAQQCPVGAIDIKRGIIEGKSQLICAPYVISTRGEPKGIHHRTYYGCGKCQVNVPCEKGLPFKSYLNASQG